MRPTCSFLREVMGLLTLASSLTRNQNHLLKLIHPLPRIFLDNSTSLSKLSGAGRGTRTPVDRSLPLTKRALSPLNHPGKIPRRISVFRINCSMLCIAVSVYLVDRTGAAPAIILLAKQAGLLTPLPAHFQIKPLTDSFI